MRERKDREERFATCVDTATGILEMSSHSCLIRVNFKNNVIRSY